MLDFLGLPWNETVLRERQSGPPTNLSHFGRAMAQARVAFAAAADSAEFSVRVRLEEQLQSAVHRYVRKRGSGYC
jgi:hypothetical protein